MDFLDNVGDWKESYSIAYMLMSIQVINVYFMYPYLIEPILNISFKKSVFYELGKIG